MHATAAMRWLAGLGMAGALVAASAMPAAAQAPNDVQLAVFFPDTTIAAGSAGKSAWAVLYASQPVILPQATITYEFAGLAGVASLRTSGPGCTPATGRITCTFPWQMDVDERGTAAFGDVQIRPAAAAKTGDSGTLRVTVEAPGYAPTSYDATVRVGDAVDLAIGPDVEVQAEAGGAFSAPMVVSNPGDTAVTGFNVLFYHDYAIRAGERYRNCTYHEGWLRSCAFEATIQPGESLAASLSYRMSTEALAPGTDWAERNIMTRTEFDDRAEYFERVGFSLGDPGDGAVLELVPTGTMSRNAQVDVDDTNNWSVMTVRLTGTNGADLAAVGGSASGAAGEIVTAQVGVANNGPAALNNDRSGEPVTAVTVTVPPGSTTVEVPEICYPLVNGELDWGRPGAAGATAYLCRTGINLLAGEEAKFTFKLRIDEVIADATGTVTANPPCECPIFDGDTDPTNDVAKLVLNPTGGGGGGGGLPVTGATTAWTAAGGLLLLVAGTAGVLLLRRRRVRFVA